MNGYVRTHSSDSMQYIRVSNQAARERAEALELRGRCYIHLGDYELAGNHFRQVSSMTFPRASSKDAVMLLACRICTPGISDVQEPTGRRASC